MNAAVGGPAAVTVGTSPASPATYQTATRTVPHDGRDVVPQENDEQQRKRHGNAKRSAEERGRFCFVELRIKEQKRASIFSGARRLFSGITLASHVTTYADRYERDFPREAAALRKKPKMVTEKVTEKVAKPQ
jgi:hypothetical protein